MGIARSPANGMMMGSATSSTASSGPMSAGIAGDILQCRTDWKSLNSQASIIGKMRVKIGKEYRKEQSEHPSFSKKEISQIVKDHEYKRKLKRCERKVHKKEPGVNQYAVCRASVKR